MVSDTVADILTRIRNASLAKNVSTIIQYSRMNLAIIKIFKEEGYIKRYVCNISTEKNKNGYPIGIIEVFIKYTGWWIKKPAFSIIKRISKPGKRIYCSYQDFSKRIPELKDGQGIAIISTSNGIMNHYKAINYKKGGELLCYIG